MMPEEEKRTHLSESYTDMVADLGGPDAWAALDGEEKERRLTNCADDLHEHLFTEALELLPASERACFERLPYVGCAAHKIMNIMKGGEKKMRTVWAQLGIAPCLLPNRDNAAVLADSVSQRSSTTRCALLT